MEADDGVEIVHLLAGATQIILPSAFTDKPLDLVMRGERVDIGPAHTTPVNPSDTHDGSDLNARQRVDIGHAPVNPSDTHDGSDLNARQRVDIGHAPVNPSDTHDGSDLNARQRVDIGHAPVNPSDTHDGSDLNARQRVDIGHAPVNPSDTHDGSDLNARQRVDIGHAPVNPSDTHDGSDLNACSLLTFNPSCLNTEQDRVNQSKSYDGSLAQGLNTRNLINQDGSDFSTHSPITNPSFPNRTDNRANQNRSYNRSLAQGLNTRNLTSHSKAPTTAWDSNTEMSTSRPYAPRSAHHQVRQTQFSQTDLSSSTQNSAQAPVCEPNDVIPAQNVTRMFTSLRFGPSIAGDYVHPTSSPNMQSIAEDDVIQNITSPPNVHKHIFGHHRSQPKDDNKLQMCYRETQNEKPDSPEAFAEGEKVASASLQNDKPDSPEAFAEGEKVASASLQNEKPASPEAFAEGEKVASASLQNEKPASPEAFAEGEKVASASLQNEKPASPEAFAEGEKAASASLQNKKLASPEAFAEGEKVASASLQNKKPASPEAFAEGEKAASASLHASTLQSTFVTTLSTGATRIAITNSTSEPKRKLGTVASPGPYVLNTVQLKGKMIPHIDVDTYPDPSESESHSSPEQNDPEIKPSLPNSDGISDMVNESLDVAESKEMLFITHTFDFLSDDFLSDDFLSDDCHFSESEEQQAHVLFDLDLDSNRSDSLEQGQVSFLDDSAGHENERTRMFAHDHDFLRDNASLETAYLDSKNSILKMNTVEDKMSDSSDATLVTSSDKRPPQGLYQPNARLGFGAKGVWEGKYFLLNPEIDKDRLSHGPSYSDEKSKDMKEKHVGSIREGKMDREASYQTIARSRFGAKSVWERKCFLLNPSLTEDRLSWSRRPTHSEEYSHEGVEKQDLSSREEIMDSDGFFSGNTFSRAMWRSVSAEATSGSLPFSRPHHNSAKNKENVIAPLDTTSSEEDSLERHQRPKSIFSRFRMKAKNARKGHWKKTAGGASGPKKSDAGITPTQPSTKKYDAGITPTQPSTKKSDAEITPTQPSTKKSDAGITPTQPSTKKSDAEITPTQPSTKKSDAEITPTQPSSNSQLLCAEDFMGATLEFADTKRSRRKRESEESALSRFNETKLGTKASTKFLPGRPSQEKSTKTAKATTAKASPKYPRVTTHDAILKNSQGSHEVSYEPTRASGMSREGFLGGYYSSFSKQGNKASPLRESSLAQTHGYANQEDQASPDASYTDGVEHAAATDNQNCLIREAVFQLSTTTDSDTTDPARSTESDTVANSHQSDMTLAKSRSSGQNHLVARTSPSLNSRSGHASLNESHRGDSDDLYQRTRSRSSVRRLSNRPGQEEHQNHNLKNLSNLKTMSPKSSVSSKSTHRSPVAKIALDSDNNKFRNEVQKTAELSSESDINGVYTRGQTSSESDNNEVYTRGQTSSESDNNEVNNERQPRASYTSRSDRTNLADNLTHDTASYTSRSDLTNLADNLTHDTASYTSRSDLTNLADNLTHDTDDNNERYKRPLSSSSLTSSGLAQIIPRDTDDFYKREQSSSSLTSGSDLPSLAENLPNDTDNFYKREQSSSSLTSRSDLPSLAENLPNDTDNDHLVKRTLSRSSSNGCITSGSEIGPLKTFPRSSRGNAWLRKGNQVTATQPLAGTLPSNQMQDEEAEEMSASELRRRFSAEEYAPASSFAARARTARSPSNLSDGARPLFVRSGSGARSGRVRQLSMDIGEEWENVHSPPPSLPPTSPLNSSLDPAFFGDAAEGREGWIPLTERPTSDVDRGAERPRDGRRRITSHRTSAKLRLLYPRPEAWRAEPTEDEMRDVLTDLTAVELQRLLRIGSPLLSLLQTKGPCSSQEIGSPLLSLLQTKGPCSAQEGTVERGKKGVRSAQEETVERGEKGVRSAQEETFETRKQGRLCSVQEETFETRKKGVRSAPDALQRHRAASPPRQQDTPADSSPSRAHGTNADSSPSRAHGTNADSSLSRAHGTNAADSLSEPRADQGNEDLHDTVFSYDQVDIAAAAAAAAAAADDDDDDDDDGDVFHGRQTVDLSLPAAFERHGGNGNTKGMGYYQTSFTSASVDPVSRKPMMTVQPTPQVASGVTTTERAQASINTSAAPTATSLTTLEPSQRGSGSSTVVTMPTDLTANNDPAPTPTSTTHVIVAMPRRLDRHGALSALDATPHWKRRTLRNPFNVWNQRCHSTLQCPCCFFYCLVCCLPALHFMQRSDTEFDQGSAREARRLGRRATALYWAGGALALTLVVTGVVTVVDVLHQLLGTERGWR